MARGALERRGVAPHPCGLLGGRRRNALLDSSISKLDCSRCLRPITPSQVEEAALTRCGLLCGYGEGSFEYCGIVFEEYRGRVGTGDFTDASKAYFFPVGVPGLFRQYNAPADFVETANTIGLPRYAKQAVDQQFARW
jgi:Phage major capsid protein E